MRKVLLGVLATTMVAMMSCSAIDGLDSSGRAPGVAVASEKQRVSSPDVPDADLNALVEGNTAFAFDLYRFLAEQEGDKNLFYSPYSISLALAMTYAGARGGTEEEMAEALHFMLSQEDLHPAFNALDQELAQRGEGAEGPRG
jgi:serpin B